jgi:site-specific DNA-methyltransferase (adenine-specific)/adenine-specific DNA-methyltransferase
MKILSDSERKELIALIEAGGPLPEKWRGRLFPGSGRAPEIGKEYRLVYDGKMRREEVLAQTPAASDRMFSVLWGQVFILDMS